MVASTAYIAAATNRFNQAADVWHGSSDLIIFGSSHLLALWDVQVRVVSVLELCSILTHGCFVSHKLVKEYSVPSLEASPWLPA